MTTAPDLPQGGALEDVIVLELPRVVVMSSNDRMNVFAKAARVKQLRRLAGFHARAWGRTYDVPVQITVTVRFSRRGKHDADNYQPTAKAVIDGFVDAGVLVDDAGAFVRRTSYQEEIGKNPPERQTFTFTFTFEPLEEATL